MFALRRLPAGHVLITGHPGVVPSSPPGGLLVPAVGVCVHVAEGVVVPLAGHIRVAAVGVVATTEGVDAVAVPGRGLRVAGLVSPGDLAVVAGVGVASNVPPLAVAVGLAVAVAAVAVGHIPGEGAGALTVLVLASLRLTVGLVVLRVVGGALGEGPAVVGEAGFAPVAIDGEAGWGSRCSVGGSAGPPVVSQTHTFLRVCFYDLLRGVRLLVGGEFTGPARGGFLGHFLSSADCSAVYCQITHKRFPTR